MSRSPSPSPPPLAAPATIRKNRLPDWSYAGYRYREAKIPKVAASPGSGLFNVLDYGAVGDGRGDDTASIRAAVAAAQAAGSGVVFLPRGHYRVSGRINVTASGIVLRGEGPRVSVLKPSQPLAAVDGFDVNAPDSLGPYSWWDGFIRVQGPPSISSDDGTRRPWDEFYVAGDEVLAQVTAPARAGARRFAVGDTGRLAAGDVVRFFMTEPEGSTALISKMYSDEILRRCPTCLDGFKRGTPDVVHFPSRISRLEPGFVVLERALPWPVDLRWRPQLRAYREGTPQESGVESLGIEFEWAPSNRHLDEEGRNGIFMFNVANCWVRDVEVVNADAGIILHNADSSTVRDVTLRVTKPRASAASRYDGHIGIGLSFCNDVLVQAFNVQQRTLHDITIRASAHAVFFEGRGADLVMDGHREGAWGTLYSKLDLGSGNRPYLPGGYKDRGYPFGSYTTFFNITKKVDIPLKFPPPTFRGPCSFGTRFNYIGPNFSPRLNPLCPGDWWVNTAVTPLPPGFRLPQVSHPFA